jgi:hypothetical protein
VGSNPTSSAQVKDSDTGLNPSVHLADRGHVDRGFDPDVANPLRGLTAHGYDGDAPVDVLGTRPTDDPSAQAAAVRTRPWSSHALRALFTAWTAIACSYRSEGPMGEMDHGTVHSRRAES